MYQMDEKRQQPAVRRPIELEKQPKPKDPTDEGGNGGGKKPPRPKRKFHFISKLIVLFLCVIALVLGMAVGYVYLGDQPMSDVWKKETWQHVVDLIFAP